MCICTTRSLGCTPETNMALFINYTNIKQKLKIKILFKRKSTLKASQIKLDRWLATYH